MGMDKGDDDKGNRTIRYRLRLIFLTYIEVLFMVLKETAFGEWRLKGFFFLYLFSVPHGPVRYLINNLFNSPGGVRAWTREVCHGSNGVKNVRNI